MQSTAPVRRLLRLSTAGSVDDGKSTLIGRLLHDTGSLAADQLSAATSESGELDLASVTDGLRAEAEQGITIDVAYRFFSTEDRDYILADTPGHERYTRNMFTGTSTSDVAVILVDARSGVLRQTRRHAVIAQLLGVRHLIAAVNKMDLVGFDPARFAAVEAGLRELAELVGIKDLLVIPVVAKDGDNIVWPSERTPWYQGPTLLERLEAIEPAEDAQTSLDMRLPVQQVIRLEGGGRRYAGRLASGRLAVGDSVTVYPEGAQATVLALDVLGESRQTAAAPLSVAVELAEDLDVGRGDLIAAGPNPPVKARELTALVCWMGEEPLRPGSRLLLKSTTRWALAQVAELQYRLDAEAVEQAPAPTLLALNDIGQVVLRLAGDLMVDPYQHNRETGSFILVDQHSNDTVGAGCVVSGRSSGGLRSPLRWSPPITPASSQGAVVWLRGEAAAADRLVTHVREQGGRGYALDFEGQFAGLSADLDYGVSGSVTGGWEEHTRRVAYLACVLADAGVIVVVSDPGSLGDPGVAAGTAELAGAALRVADAAQSLTFQDLLP